MADQTPRDGTLPIDTTHGSTSPTRRCPVPTPHRGGLRVSEQVRDGPNLSPSTRRPAHGQGGHTMPVPGALRVGSTGSGSLPLDADKPPEGAKRYTRINPLFFPACHRGHGPKFRAFRPRVQPTICDMQ